MFLDNFAKGILYSGVVHVKHNLAAATSSNRMISTKQVYFYALHYHAGCSFCSCSVTDWGPWSTQRSKYDNGLVGTRASFRLGCYLPHPLQVHLRRLWARVSTSSLTRVSIQGWMCETFPKRPQRALHPSLQLCNNVETWQVNTILFAILIAQNNQGLSDPIRMQRYPLHVDIYSFAAEARVWLYASSQRPGFSILQLHGNRSEKPCVPMSPRFQEDSSIDMSISQTEQRTASFQQLSPTHQTIAEDRIRQSQADQPKNRRGKARQAARRSYSSQVWLLRSLTRYYTLGALCV